ncbi:multidrug DMT transporter permease [Leucobacter rhizosphaerae]|uniref:Multidrug DMT transporter permease n=1 Tax=Leucobacter rhizosphaerae TaxID=2932245 RepID=A0ABY4FT05_9MICO|nr:multidrug DMT transporter permease [Leucobacter rhizosphaerae]UOQ59435.1 multidrug DMT transporter permease [Leucobacter rhizosphaerae]
MLVGSMPVVGVLLALLSAAVLSVGNLWQSRGVNAAAERASGAASFMQLLKTPVWVGGTVLFGIAILLQMGSLALAPLIVVQPIGVAALVFTALLTARATGQRPSRAVVRAIVISLIGVTGFVVVAALVSHQKPIGDQQLIEMMMTLVAVLIAAGVVVVFGKGGKLPPLVYVVLGGVFSGFVATLGKTVILRVESMFTGGHFQFGSESLLTLLCVLGIGVASVLSIFFVQYSHTCNPPDVVIAGLTVIDPALAVILGITILQEAAGAPMWSTVAFVVAGVVAVSGVIRLARAEDPGDDADGADGADREAAGAGAPADTAPTTR